MRTDRRYVGRWMAMMMSGAVSLLLSGCIPMLFEGMTSSDETDWTEAALDGREEAPEHLWCSGPSPTGDGAGNRSMSYDIRVEGDAVQGTMEVLLCGSASSPDEAVLRFPLPRGAVIRGAEVFLASQDRWEVAETVGRRQGEAIYEDIIEPDDIIDPLLIQQIGMDLYRARVFPVDAWVGGRFRVHYAHTLEHTDEIDGSRRLRIALEDPDALPFDPERGLHITITTEAGFWERGAWSGSEEISGGLDFDAEDGFGWAELTSERIEGDLSLELVPVEPLGQASMLRYVPVDGDLAEHTFVTWLPDLFDHPELEPQPRNVVLVVDVSGSMSGRKLSQMKSGVVHVLRQLSGDDRFAVVAFDSDTYAFSNEMSSASDADEAIRWVEALSAGSSTAMADGLVRGARIGLDKLRDGEPLDLLLISDGLPNSGADTPEDILAELGHVTDGAGGTLRVFGCGIGYDLSQGFLNELTQPTGGEATFALDDSEITGQILDLFERVRGGGLENVMVVAEGLEDDPLELRRLLPGTPVSLGLTDSLHEDVALSLAGFAPSRSVVNVEAEVALGPAGSEGIHLIAPALAAKAWSDRLERRIDEEGETDELVGEAVILARRYGIVTRYTSMLALESPEMYDDYGVQRPARDPAGIALEEVEGPSTNEQRIGGEGADALYAGADAMDMAGCTCRAAGGETPSPAAALLFALVALIFRRFRR